jgi:hypothetical protein
MNQPTKILRLTDEMIDVIVERLGRFPDDDTDAHTVGKEVSRQQLHDPNHHDEPKLNIFMGGKKI